MDNIHFYTNVLKNMVVSFFQGGIWVVGFFYLLVKTFDNRLLKKISAYILGVSLLILLVYSILFSL